MQERLPPLSPKEPPHRVLHYGDQKVISERFRVSHSFPYRNPLGYTGPFIWLVMVIVVMTLGVGCGGENLGTLQVTIRLETVLGVSRGCSDIGADKLELTFFADSGDLVAHDVITVVCEATGSGWATYGLLLTARNYHKVVLRFLTATGSVVRVCGDVGRIDAVLEQDDVMVEAGMLRTLDFVLVGDSQPCAE